MKKIFLWVIVVLILLVIGYYVFIFYTYDFNLSFFKIDICSRKGGVWNYNEKKCVFYDPKEKDIITTIDIAFKTTDPLRNKKLGSNVFSQSLNNLIISANAIEDSSIQQIARSEYPTDKPDIIEGEIFASLYEGYSSYLVKNISVHNDSAFVLVEFTNSDYNLTWIDKVLLVNEGKWKIDNVFYLKDSLEYSLHSNTKKILTNFIKAN